MAGHRGQATGGKPRLELIVAVAENGVIGRGGELPWRLAADLRRFKALTMGCALVMGRKTFESIGRPLPGRTSVVLTRDREWKAQHGVLVAHELSDALSLASSAEGMSRGAVFVIGGAEIYQLAEPIADRAHITRVHAEVDGDAFFPQLDPAEWRRTEAIDHPADDENEHPFTFETWERVAQ